MSPSENDALDAASVLASLASQSPTGPPPPDDNIAHATSNHEEGASGTVKDEHFDASKSTDLAHDDQGFPVAEDVPTQSTEVVNPSVDEETAKAIAAATNEYNTRIRGPARQRADMVPTPDYASPELMEKLPSKKRKAPEGTKNLTVKKRKSEAPSDRATPTSSRKSPSPTPAQNRPQKAQVPRKPRRTKAEMASSLASAEDPGSQSDGSDAELYCICRKPDNHTWMIGCDGGCEDWFHGKCVQIQKEDEKLIDKYICPNCVESGKGVTTWKPMCRRDGCRKAARLKKGSESKYCSDECGERFMKDNLNRAAGQLREPTPKKRHKSDGSSPPTGRRNEDALPYVGPLGGPIRMNELKSMVDRITNIDDFRRLGDSPFLTPPPSAHAEGSDSNGVKPNSELQFTESEKQRLDGIEARKDELRQKHALLKDRGRFVQMMRNRVPKIGQKLKIKDVCGFDSTWILDDVNFKRWRDSDEGRQAFDADSLEVPDSFEGDGENKPKICTRKGRCIRHGSWQKMVYNDFRFESDDVGNEMRRIDAEAKEIHEAATMRQRTTAPSEHSESGWVEIVRQKTSGVATPPMKVAVKMEDVKMEGTHIEDDVRPAYHINTAGDSTPLSNS